MNLDQIQKIIPNRDFIKIRPLNLGWSEDKKYVLSDIQNHHYLLRISEKKAPTFNHHLSNAMAHLSVNPQFPKIIAYGQYSDSHYILLEWLEGEPLENVLPTLNPLDQYILGKQTGLLLKAIHAFKILDSEPLYFDFPDYYKRKINHKIHAYQNCSIHYPNDDHLLQCIDTNIHFLDSLTEIVFQHGDYHIGNMVIDDQNTIKIIDFDRYDFGNPWEEFNRIVWDIKVSPEFAAGRLDAYFDHQIPKEFFSLLKLFVALNAISSLPWALQYEEEDLQTMFQNNVLIYEWFDNFQTDIPSWYLHAKKNIQSLSKLADS